MNHLYFVLVPNSAECATPASAEVAAGHFLDEQGFAFPTSRFFVRSKADSYQIGGGWIQLLAQINGDGAAIEALREKLRPLPFTKKREAILASRATVPVACLFSRDFFEKFKAFAEREWAEEGGWGGLECFDIGEFRELFIKDAAGFADGSRWLVVVDYHD